ncbi:MAG: helix-turn-helix domain-containing protein [Flavobacteriales bacterium]|nr:helix-turn-helix domain-containing protein [Flavobacteriales bacterium]
MFSSTSQVAKDLASRCRKIRTQKNLTQQQLADQSGVSLGSLKRFESSGKISLESLLKIVLVLGRLSEFEQLLKASDLPRSINDLFK